MAEKIRAQFYLHTQINVQKVVKLDRAQENALLQNKWQLFYQVYNELNTTKFQEIKTLFCMRGIIKETVSANFIDVQVTHPLPKQMIRKIQQHIHFI